MSPPAGHRPGEDIRPWWDLIDWWNTPSLAYIKGMIDGLEMAYARDDTEWRTTVRNLRKGLQTIDARRRAGGQP